MSLKEVPMDDMTARMAEQLKSNPAMLRSLMQSQDGQMLLRMLTQLKITKKLLI